VRVQRDDRKQCSLGIEEVKENERFESLAEIGRTHRSGDGPVTQATGPMHDLAQALSSHRGGFTHNETPCFYAPIATSQSRLCHTAFLPVEHRSRVVQPNTQLDFTENTALRRNWSDGMLGSARILGVQWADLSDGMLLYLELSDSQIER